MNRRGNALLIVLFLLALLLGLSAMVAGQARLRWLAGTRALAAARLDLLGDARLARTLPQWDPQVASRVMPGAAEAMLSPVPSVPGLQVEDSLRRLGALLFERRVSLSQFTPDGAALLARVSRQLLVQLLAPAIPDSGAVHAGGGLILDGASRVDGADRLPAGWGGYCPVTGGAVAGVRLGPAAVLGGSCPAGTCLSGSPPQAVDSLAPSFWSAGAGWFGLSAGAARQVSGLVIGPGAVVAGSSCDQSQLLNWGDPANPASACGDYFPLIVAQPGTEVRDGSGQGVILGLGSLVLSGSLRFSGVLLAQGGVELRDGVQFTGTVIARDTVRVGDLASVGWSRCAVSRSRVGAAQPARVAGWSSSRLP